MRIDPVEDALNRQPTWEPPPGFARGIVARMPAPAAPAQSAGRTARLEAIRGAAPAFAIGSVASMLGVALLRDIPLLTRAAASAAADYGMFVEEMIGALAARADVVSWIAAAVSLSLAASVSGRLREWL